jgi:hypothetical protein
MHGDGGGGHGGHGGGHGGDGTGADNHAAPPRQEPIHLIHTQQAHVSHRVDAQVRHRVDANGQWVVTLSESSTDGPAAVVPDRRPPRDDDDEPGLGSVAE